MAGRRSQQRARGIGATSSSRASDAPAVPADRIRASFRAMLSLETLRAAPKVLLHDHLDGGLRPTTIVELARDQKYAGLPTTDPGELARWFHENAASGSLSLYLHGFAHTIAVMQTVEAIERVAYERGEDLARDGIVYAEVRYAPVFSTQGGRYLEQLVVAVVCGFERVEGSVMIALLGLTWMF